MKGSTAKPGRPPGAVLPDSAWSWLVVVGNMVIGVTTLGFFRSIPVFFRSIMLEFEIDYAKLSTIPGLCCSGMAVSCFLLRFLTSKFGSQWTCFVAGLVMGTSNAISSFADSFIVIQICTGFITGFCMGILVFTMISSSSQYFRKHRAKATGISTIGIPLGTLILAPSADLLIEYYGWRGALLILSGIILNSAVSATLYRPVVLPEYIPRKKSSIFIRNNSGIRKISTSSGSKKSSIPASLIQNTGTNTTIPGSNHSTEVNDSNNQDELTSDISRNKTFWNTGKKKIKAVIDYELFKSISYDIGLLSSIFFYSGYVTANTFLVPLAHDYVGLGSLQASTLLSISGGAECIAKVVTGFIADAKWINKCILLAFMCIICSFIIVAMTFCHNYLGLAIAAFVYGLFVTAYVGIIAVIFCDSVGPHKIGTAVAYQGCLYALFLGPCLYLMGLMVDATGDARRTFYTCACLLALTSVCLMVIYGLQVWKKKVKARNLQEEVVES